MSHTGINPEVDAGLRVTSVEKPSKAMEVISSDNEMFKQYIKETFQDRPSYSASAGYGNPTGTGGDENIIKTAYNTFEYHILGTQTIVAPVWSTDGLNIALDQTDNDGVEISTGITARNRGTFVVGTDYFYMQVTYDIADVSGTDDFAVGFRKAEAYQANIDDYDEMYAVNLISGDLKIETILNAGATDTTDTTLNVADAGQVTIRIEVDLDGVATCKIAESSTADLDTPPTTVSFTFDSGEVVIPFIYLLQATDLTGDVNLKNFECGKLYNSVRNS